MVSKKILYVDNRVEYVISHRIPWLRGARDAGFDVHVTTLTTGKAEDEARIAEAGFTYHSISDHKRSNNPLWEAQLIARLYKLYKKLNPVLVHHITLRSMLYGGAANRLACGSKVVNGVTGLGYLFSGPGLKLRLLRRFMLQAVRALTREDHAFIFQNPDDERLFRDHDVIGPASSIVIRGSGVDVDRFTQSPEPLEARVILFPARMLWHKGVQEFVDAARRVKAEESTEVRFVMVGGIDSDNPAGVPARQLKQWEKEGIIEWWEYQESMPDVFAQSHVVCLPSMYREGVPKVLIEAASCGRPIVTTDMPGCREIVRDKENGYLVPPGDSEAVAEAVSRLIQNDKLRSRMGNRGRKLVQEEFSVESVVTSTVDVYKNILAKQSTSA